jgi:sialidase-1
MQGKSWPDGVPVWSGPSAYSQLVSLGDDSTVGVLFEAGSKMAYETISFATVKVA